MNTLTAADPAAPSSTDDALLHVQTLIARRADELSFQSDHRPGRDLACWLQAEREILSWFLDAGLKPFA